MREDNFEIKSRRHCILPSCVSKPGYPLISYFMIDNSKTEDLFSQFVVQGEQTKLVIKTKCVYNGKCSTYICL